MLFSPCCIADAASFAFITFRLRHYFRRRCQFFFFFVIFATRCRFSFHAMAFDFFIMPCFHAAATPGVVIITLIFIYFAPWYWFATFIVAIRCFFAISPAPCYAAADAADAARCRFSSMLIYAFAAWLRAYYFASLLMLADIRRFGFHAFTPYAERHAVFITPFRYFRHISPLFSPIFRWYMLRATLPSVITLYATYAIISPPIRHEAFSLLRFCITPLRAIFITTMSYRQHTIVKMISPYIRRIVRHY